MMIIGFTGTRNGLTRAQTDTLMGALQRFAPSAVRLGVRAVHGDCVGADAEFDAACAVFGVTRGIRPCTFEDLRAHCEKRGAEVLAAPKPAMQRNRDIVADADVLIACPPNFDRLKSGSGTWATIGFGEGKRIEVIVIFPDGTVRP